MPSTPAAFRIVVGLARHDDAGDLIPVYISDTGTVILGDTDGTDPNDVDPFAATMVAAAAIGWAIDHGADRDEIMAYA